MTVHLPMFYGVIVRKSAKTADYVARCNSGHAERYPGVPQNEDEHLLAVSIAMSGDDADYVAEAFQRGGWVRGVDFEMVISGDGLRVPAPDWLEEFEFRPPAVSTEPHPIRSSAPHKAYRLATESASR